MAADLLTRLLNPAGLVLAYGAAINVVGAGAFAYDKKCAVEGKWRVSESTLCTTALLGGWLGGMWAMQQFHHKTKKKSFQEKYYTAVGLNVAGVAGGLSTPIGRRFLAKLPQMGRR